MPRQNLEPRWPKPVGLYVRQLTLGTSETRQNVRKACQALDPVFLIQLIPGPDGAAVQKWHLGDRVARMRARTQWRQPRLGLGDPDIARASELEHPVQSGGGDGDLGGLGLVRPGAQGIADHALVSTDRRLDLGPKIVATGFLPAHATV
jgi:hypothetical protein